MLSFHFCLFTQSHEDSAKSECQGFVSVGTTVLTSLGDHLRTAQVEVDSVTVVLSQQGCPNKHLRIIGAKLAQTENATL